MPDDPSAVRSIARIVRAALILALLGIAAVTYGSAGDKEILSADERAWLTRNQSHLVLALETGYAPFVFIDAQDQPTGLAHDYMRLIEAKLGVHFKQKRYSTLDEIFHGVQAGEVHIVNAVTSTPARAKFLLITDPYISVPNVIIVRKDRTSPVSEHELSGLRVALVKSYAITEHMTSRGSDFTPDIVPNDLAALLEVSFGRSDAAVIDLATASYLISEKGISNLRVAGEVGYDIRLSVATPSKELYGILKKGLAAITDAERQEIKNRWINASKSQSIFKDRQFWMVLASVIAAALVIFSVILAWNRTLRREAALRKKAEEMLRLSEEQMATSQQIGGTGSWVYDVVTTSIRASANSLALFGLPPEARDYPLDEFLACIPERDRVRLTLAAAIDGGLVYDDEFVMNPADGSPQKIIHSIGRLEQDAQGKPCKVSGFIQDITLRKAFEEELKRSNTELEQFSYAVSHDMRQPLRMVSSYLQLLELNLADQLSGEKRDYFNHAIEGAKRIEQMLSALLEYSRVGRMGEPPTWIASRSILDEVLRFLQPAIAEAQARLAIDGDWPSIMASHDEILRLLQNLAGNAIKYRMTGRTPEITITSGITNHEWEICVADNGVGIAPDQIKRLFQVFQRLHTRDAYEGTGIGLALCRKIAEHHNGRIWAESAGEGLGSKFHVVLPVVH